MGIIDRLFRRNRETKTTPIAETEVKHRIVTSAPSVNPTRRKKTAKRKARRVSKASRRKNRR